VFGSNRVNTQNTPKAHPLSHRSMHNCTVCSNVPEEIIANSRISHAACISQQTGLQVYFPSKALCLFIASSFLVI
jgi:hypothetical protein